ncbi:hypothetical protein LENED_000651 [Lentinula edodes]|uniref:Uncharacterized protein n=1 Tax=Lentinula edodes TaxID=5353 RepID=A0A1Q3DWU2_LENED|nr:hypothetical protein LENED_000651 [Lentinula edodes]
MLKVIAFSPEQIFGKVSTITRYSDELCKEPASPVKLQCCGSLEALRVATAIRLLESALIPIVDLQGFKCKLYSNLTPKNGSQMDRLLHHWHQRHYVGSGELVSVFLRLNIENSRGR